MVHLGSIQFGLHFLERRRFLLSRRLCQTKDRMRTVSEHKICLSVYMDAGEDGILMISNFNYPLSEAANSRLSMS